MVFTIREASAEDSARIAEVLHQSFREYDSVFDPPSGAISETEESIRKKLNSCSGFVAEVECDVVGNVFCNPNESGNYYIHRLAVLPSFRKHGVGRTLIERVEALAIKEGFDTLQLGTRLVIPKMIAYYRHLGFEQTGVMNRKRVSPLSQ